jgi:sortase A
MAKSDTSLKSRHPFWNIFCLYVLIFGILVGLYTVLTALSPILVDLPIIRDAIKKPETSERVAQDDRLYIPQLGVNVAIVTGDTEEVLTKGAWHRKPENGDPEKGGNFVLSAHRFVMSWTPGQTVERSPFYNIGKLQLGERFTVDYHAVRYVYVITKKYKVSPQQSDIEAKTAEPTLTLYSCTLRGSSDGRDVIEAQLVRS